MGIQIQNITDSTSGESTGMGTHITNRTLVLFTFTILSVPHAGIWMDVTKKVYIITMMEDTHAEIMKKTIKRICMAGSNGPTPSRFILALFSKKSAARGSSTVLITLENTLR